MGTAIENGFVRQLWIIGLFALLVICTPVCIVMAAILLVTRFLLTLYKNVAMPDYGPFLEGMNNFFASDDPYDRPLATVSGHSFIQTIYPPPGGGQVSVAQMQEELTKKMAEFQSHPDPMFPELRHFVTTWLGFAVFRREKNFQVNDHLNLLSVLHPQFADVEIDEENVSNFCFKLSRLPFAKDKSPWEILIHHKVKLKDNDKNKKESASVMFIRLHHTLADALASLKFIGHLSDEPDVFENFIAKFKKSAARSGRRKSLTEKVGYALSFPFLGLYEVASLLLNSWDDNVFHPAGQPEIRRQFIYIKFPPIPKARIQKLRDKLGGVKFFSVILAAFTGGLRKYMVSREIPVPDNFHAVISIPVPKKASRLSNNITNSIIRVPIGLRDRREILGVIENDSERAKTSRYPLVMLMVSMFLGLFPRKLLFNRWIFTTMATTNFPGFDNPVNFLKNRVLNVDAVATMPSATTGVYFWSSGYKDLVTLTLGLSTHIVSSMEEMKLIRQLIQGEFEALENENS